MMVTPPCLNISRLIPSPRPHPNIVDLHAGWCAARNREPLDDTQSAAWQVGWRLWHETQQQKLARELRLALADMPRVAPRT